MRSERRIEDKALAAEFGHEVKPEASDKSLEDGSEAEKERLKEAEIKVRAAEKEVVRLRELGSSDFAKREGLNIQRAIKSAEENLQVASEKWEALKFEIDNSQVGLPQELERLKEPKETDSVVDSAEHSDISTNQAGHEAVQSLHSLASEHLPGHDGSLAVWKAMQEALAEEPDSRRGRK